MKATEPCIFCRIVAKEVPAYTVYEDKDCLAFLDINPVNPGHLLVIPKGHYKTITDMPEKLHGHIYQVAWRLALKLQQELDPDGLKVLQNNNEQAGQVVPHFHVHLIPRVEGDGEYYREAWKSRKLSQDEFEALKAKLSL